MQSHGVADAWQAVQKELQEKLAQRGLPKSGNKAQLAQRLHAALAEEQDMVLTGSGGGAEMSCSASSKESHAES